MNTSPLCDLLGAEQFKEVLRIIQEYRRDDVAMAIALRDYLGQHRAQLEDRGILPEYLAYALVYKSKEL